MQTHKEAGFALKSVRTETKKTHQSVKVKDNMVKPHGRLVVVD